MAQRPGSETLTSERRAALHDAVAKEAKSNADIVEQSTGRIVCYGEVVQLRHCKTQQFLQVA